MNVSIIGCGIAGPVLALALKRANIESTIYEAYGYGADFSGAYLTMGANGLNALCAIDADTPVRNFGFLTPYLAFSNAAGRSLGSMRTGSDDTGSFASVTIKRADLYRALRTQAEEAGIEIRYGMRLVDARPDGESVVARFEDGAIERAGLLVGCDGVRSRVRSIIDPLAPTERRIPLVNAGGYARGVTLDAQPGTFHMIFGKRAFFAYILAPANEVWWFANIPVQETRALPKLFAGDAGPALEIIAKTYEFIPVTETFDLPSVPRWSRERMIVIGDAAHAAAPSSGQGASLAIEDAVVLAKCLRDFPAGEALAQYESLRRSRVERVVAEAARTSNSKIPGPLGSAIRDAFLRFMIKRVRRDDRGRWLREYTIEWNGSVATKT